MRIAFAGLGSMGSPMAANLAAAGHTVVGYRRSQGSTEASPAPPEGVRLTNDLAEAARDAEILVTMLPSDAAARQVAMEALGALPAGAVHCAMSTVSPDLTRELASAYGERRLGYVAAPVFGRPDAAKAKRLWIVPAGAGADVARCAPLFEAMGRGTTPAGDEPWRANLIKIGGNFLIVAAIESLGEAVSLMRQADVPPDLFLEAIGNVFGSPLYANYGAQIVERRFEPAGFKLELGLKDVRLALAEADAAHAPMPLASLLHDHLLSAIAHGDGDRDWTAVTEVLGRLANANHPAASPA